MEMKPEVKKINAAQILITLTLVGLLISLLGLYIYYGMYQARQVAPVAEVVTPVALDPDDARRQEIIAALQNKSEATVGLDTRVIVNGLKQDPAEAETAESEKKRAAIIDALHQN